MATMEFTKRAIEALPAPDPSGKQTLYWAEGTATPGLGILVSGVTATKTWVCQANMPNGKSRRIKVGPVAVFSLEKAWEEAAPKVAAIIQGRDPKLTAPQKQMAGMTTAQVLEDYLKANSNLRSSTISIYKGAAKHLGPLLDHAMRDITPEMVEQRFRAIEQDVVARREAGKIRGGTAVTGKAIANVALRLLGSIWTFQSERDEGLGDNPVKGQRFKRQWHELDERERHIPMDRLADFYRAARALPSDIQRDVVLIGLFTGMRANEVEGLKWEGEVDLVNKMLVLPARRMKARKAFQLPMSDLIHSVLMARRIIGREGPYVFPGHGSATGHTESFTWAMQRIGASSGIKASPHDLRRTYISIAGTSNIPPIALKMLVAHSTGKKSDITTGYMHSTEQLRKPRKWSPTGQGIVQDRHQGIVQDRNADGECERVALGETYSLAGPRFCIFIERS